MGSRFHHSTKRDHSESTKYSIIKICIDSIQQSHQITPARYQIRGTATILHKGIEVSKKLDDTVRHAAGSVEICKCNWHETTIDNIDWFIHGKALRKLSETGRKTCTQLIDEWLPVHGHPGQALPLPHQTCRLCKENIGTQAHLLQCSGLHDQWTQIIHRATIGQFKKKHLNNLLACALTKCRT
jgi:hypothetical protein